MWFAFLSSELSGAFTYKSFFSSGVSLGSWCFLNHSEGLSPLQPRSTTPVSLSRLLCHGEGTFLFKIRSFHCSFWWGTCDWQVSPFFPPLSLFLNKHFSRRCVEILDANIPPDIKNRWLWTSFLLRHYFVFKYIHV